MRPQFEEEIWDDPECRLEMEDLDAWNCVSFGLDNFTNPGDPAEWKRTHLTLSEDATSKEDTRADDNASQTSEGSADSHEVDDVAAAFSRYEFPFDEMELEIPHDLPHGDTKRRKVPFPLENFLPDSDLPYDIASLYGATHGNRKPRYVAELKFALLLTECESDSECASPTGGDSPVLPTRRGSADSSTSKQEKDGTWLGDYTLDVPWGNNSRGDWAPFGIRNSYTLDVPWGNNSTGEWAPFGMRVGNNPPSDSGGASSSYHSKIICIGNCCTSVDMHALQIVN